MSVYLLLLCSGVVGQTLPDPDTVFPSTGTRPASADAELLEAVCPGHVQLRAGFRCAIPCPSYTAFNKESFEWSLARVTRGHFLSPASEDAVLSMDGCEPHSNNWGGSILLTRRKERWRMIWYRAGVDTNHCRNVSLRSGREVLICLGSYGSQGLVNTDLYLEDLVDPAFSLMEGDGGFFNVTDTMSTCGEADDPPGSVRRGYIERVEFVEEDSQRMPLLIVTAVQGKRTLTSAEVQECLAGPGRPRPPSVKTTRRQITFAFDGKRYRARNRGVLP